MMSSLEVLPTGLQKETLSRIKSQIMTESSFSSGQQFIVQHWPDLSL